MTLKPTVLQVIPALDAGGAERATVEIARALKRVGGRALVAARGGRLASEIEAVGGEIFPMPVHSKNPLDIIANRARLIALIRRERVDLVHVRSRAPAWSALWAARAAGLPLVATYHGAYGAASPLKRFYNSAMVRADLVIANSAFTAAAIRASYTQTPRRLVVIPRGADLDAFDPAAVEPARIEALEREWGLGGGFKLLLPGRLTEWKGQLVAIAAVERLVNARLKNGAGFGGDLTLILCGDAQGRDGYAERLRREINARGVREMVKLVGHCADMPAAYSLADAVLSPSTRPEAFGRVAVEAAAMGKPVIAADHGGARETVIDNETGILTPPGDVEAVADAIADLARMGEAGRAAMGARGQARVRRLYSADAMAAATLAAYDDILMSWPGRARPAEQAHVRA